MLWSVVLLFLTPCSLGADDTELSPKAVAQSIASAREQIVSYRVHISMKSSAERVDGDAGAVKETMEQFYFEYSRLEDHFVCARQKSAGEGWTLSGQSDGLKFSCSGKQLGYSTDFSSERLYFDPLACGLLHCEQFSRFWSFEDELLQISRDSGPEYQVQKTADGLLILSSPVGRKLMIDTKRGYWPISKEHIDSFKSPRLKELGTDKTEKILTQQLKKIKDQHVPSTTKMSCFDDRKVGRRRIELSFDWIDVNDPIPTGIAALESVAQKLKLELRKQNK